MNSIFTIAAGVVLGLLLTATLVGIGLFIYRMAGSNTGRQQLIFASVAAGLATTVALLVWFGSSLASSTYRQYEHEQSYRRQVQHARDWCAGFKHAMIARYTGPNKSQREAWFENPASDMSYPFEKEKWHSGILQSALTSPGMKQLSPAAQLALCHYLGIIAQPEMTAAIEAKINSQREFESSQRKKCENMKSPLSPECFGYGPSLDKLFPARK